MSERFTEDGRRRVTESAVTSGQGGVPLVRIIERNGVQWSAAISSETPSPVVDAHIADYWRETARIRRLLHCSPDPDAHVRAWRQSLHDAHIRAWLSAPEVLLATVERLKREDANALADDLAARLNVEPKVLRAKLRTLQNDFYRLSEPENDWWDETQRAEAEAETVAAFAEKLEDLYAAALAKSRRSTAQKAATKRRVRKALIEVRKEHPGAKEHRIDELAASKANVGERTLQRYKPRR